MVKGERNDIKKRTRNSKAKYYTGTKDTNVRERQREKFLCRVTVTQKDEEEEEKEQGVVTFDYVSHPLISYLCP